MGFWKRLTGKVVSQTQYDYMERRRNDWKATATGDASRQRSKLETLRATHDKLKASMPQVLYGKIKEGAKKKWRVELFDNPEFAGSPRLMHPVAGFATAGEAQSDLRGLVILGKVRIIAYVKPPAKPRKSRARK